MAVRASVRRAIVNTVAYDNNGLGTQERDATPQIVISQGRLPDESGEAGDAGHSRAVR